MREQSGKTRIVFKSHVIDDGWNLPEEVIEEIEFRIKESREAAVRKVQHDHKSHKGDWLTKEIADAYIAKTWPHRVLSGNQYIGIVREYGKELQELYGVTEIEAINILMNNRVNDYVEKYYRIKNLIPVYANEEEICEEVIAEYFIGIS